MLRDPPRPPRARTQRQPQPRGRTSPPAHSPRPGAVVFPPKAPHAPNMAPQSGVPRRWLEKGSGPDRPGGPELRERPPGRRPRSAGAAQRDPPSPARLRSDSPPRSPLARQGQKKLPGGGGKAGRAAAWGPGWRWRPARRCAGDSAREEAAAQGSPAPLCRRHGGSAELRRGPRPDSERGGPTSSWLPSRAGEGAAAVLQGT